MRRFMDHKPNIILIMVTMVFGLPVPTDTDSDSFTIFNNPVNYLHTFREMAADYYDWAIYLETTF